MSEPCTAITIALPASVHRALIREAGRRTTEAGKSVSAATVVREAVAEALNLPVPRVVRGRPPLPPSTATITPTTAPVVRNRIRATPPAAA